MNQPSHAVDVTVYRITGKQGLIEVPHRYCEECDLTVQLVQRVMNDLDTGAARLTVRPWLLWFWKPLFRGGWHAPIVTVNGRVVSQGVVPAADIIRKAIAEARTSERECPDRLAQTQ